MDIYIPIVICVIFFILCSICGWCCKRKREGTVYGFGPNVTVATQHVSASPVVQPPYPVEPHHPTPQTGGIMPTPYPQQPPYPTHTPHPMPVPAYYPPPPVGGVPYSTMPAPYPPAPYNPGVAPYPPSNERGGLPPSYNEAVNQPPAQPPPTNEFYGKQAPYNPNY